MLKVKKSMLRATLAVLLALVGLEVLLIVGVLLADNSDAYAAESREMWLTRATDIAYVAPAEDATLAEATEEVAAEEASGADEAATEEATDWSAEELYEYYGALTYEEIAEIYGLVPYDESGYYNANLNGAWYGSGEFEYTGGYLYKDGSGMEFTWYPERVLPGGGLNIPGRHVGDEGYICDENENICLASGYLPEGTVVSVPFGGGTGVVYDSGCAVNDLDVYVSW